MKKYIIIIAASIVSIHASAQEYRTDVSVRQQILDGTTPGAVKSTEVKKAPVANKAPNEEFRKQVKSNQLPGERYKTGNEKSQMQAASTAQKKSGKKLASEGPAQPAKKQEPTAIQIPSQGKMSEK